MKPLLLVLHLPAPVTDRLTALGLEAGQVEQRRFPDGETYLRISSPCCGRPVVIGCGLDGPDQRLAGLLFAAETARELGATAVGLVAPYLAYMRQDAAFRPGESVSARHFARLLSDHFDWLVTVDPHLHRLRSLREVYDIPTRIAHAAPAIADWLSGNVSRPLLIGPDQESEQWVAEIARSAAAPYRILAKLRHGDRDVEVSGPELTGLQDRTPVVIDDIVSSGQTMVQAARCLRRQGLAAPVCIAVHAILANGALQALRDAGVARLLTCNTIAHDTNGIDISAALAEQVHASLPRAPDLETV